MSQRPLCFVLMPFGEKPSGSGGTIDFDAVFEELIRPAVETAGMQPLRADEELTGGSSTSRCSSGWCCANTRSPT